MSYEVKSLNEECGIFGVWGHPDAASVAYFGLHSLQHRGQEGAGIVSNDRGKLMGHRDLGLLSEVFKDQRKLQQLTGEAAIGHVRYATAGNGSVDNIQPFLFKFHDQSIGLAHNGNLINARSLRKELEENGAIFHSNSDTEILMHLIRRSEETDFLNKLNCRFGPEWFSSISNRTNEKRSIRDCLGNLCIRSYWGTFYKRCPAW